MELESPKRARRLQWTLCAQGRPPVSGCDDVAVVVVKKRRKVAQAGGVGLENGQATSSRTCSCRSKTQSDKVKVKVGPAPKKNLSPLPG